MIGCDDDASEGTAYLAPRDIKRHLSIGRQYSANDSGIVEFAGSRHGSKTGFSVANDCYSDPGNLPGSPRILSSVPEMKNGHAALCNQFSYPICTRPSKPTIEISMKAYEDMSQSQRNKDDLNLYTSIDDAMLFQSSNSESKTEAAPPVCNFRRQLSSGQTSFDPGQAAGRENILYEPARVERSRCMQGERKTWDISRKSCIRVVFYLLATTAFVLAVVNLVSEASDTRYEKLCAAHRTLQAQHEGLKQSLSDFENKSNANMTERLKELNDSVASIVSESDESISVLLFRLIKNDSQLQQRLFEWLDRSMDSLKANISLEVDSSEKKVSQLVLQSRDQLREDFSARLPINMSQCKYEYRSETIGADMQVHSTEEYTFNDRFLLRAFCTTEGGTDSFMEYNMDRPNVYKCTCSGKSGRSHDRACIFHYWVCPYL